MSLIYCKFSNDRAEKYNIKTSIEEMNGKRVVYKEACSSESQSHIFKIADYYEALQRIYDNTIFDANHCELEGERLAFEYIEGVTLEESLDALKEEKRYSDIVSLIEKYVNNINMILGKQQFIKTLEFVNIFGDIDGLEQYEAFSISNIDMVFGNVVISDLKWVVIDYEWTFLFPVPVKYIIYRALYYYISGSRKREDLLELELYKHFGISEQEQALFFGMEQNYQNYVSKDHASLWTLEESMAKQKIRIDLLKNRIDLLLHQQQIYAQVYYDDGEGYQESNSQILYITETFPAKVKIQLDVQPNRKYRIDPCNVPCFQKNLCFYNERGEELVLSYRSNGFDFQQVNWFIIEDPQMELENVSEEIKELWCEYEIGIVDNYIGEACSNLFISAKESFVKLDREEEVNALLRRDIEYLQGEQQKLNTSVAMLQENIEQLQMDIAEKDKFIQKVKNLLPFKIYAKCQQVLKNRR